MVFASRLLRGAKIVLPRADRPWVDALLNELPDVPAGERGRWVVGGLVLVGRTALRRPRTYLAAVVIAIVAVACTVLPTLGILILLAAPTALGGLYMAWADRRLGGWLSDYTQDFWHNQGFK